MRAYTRHKKMIAAFQSVILTLISYPVLIVIIAIISIYRSSINALLWMKLGKKYGGLLPSSDCLYCVKNTSPPNILSIFILRSDKKLDVLNLFRKTFRRKVFYCPDNYPKLTATMHMFSGYPYLIKNSCTLAECIRPMELAKNDILNEEYLKILMGNINSKPFPHHNTGLWEIITTEIPLEDNFYKDKYYRYPVVLRFHHALGNGTSLISFLIKMFSNEKADIYSKNMLGQERTEINTYFYTVNHNCNKVKNYLKSAIPIALMGAGRCMQIHRLKPKVTFHPIPCGEKIVSWTVENNVTFLPMVKRIKNRVPGVKFSDVILTAISASLSNFFNSNFKQIPDSIPAMLPVLLEFPKLHKSKCVPLENTTTAGFIQMPLIKTKSLLETLENISAKIKDLRYEDIIVIAYLVKGMGFFPTNIINKILSNASQVCLITNVPGCSQLQFREGCILEKIIPLAPNTYISGISFALLTYDDRLQLGILVDKKIISSQEVAQKLVDDVFHYLNLLDVESKNIYG